LDKKLNVLAVDDHTLFRKGTVMLLESFDETDSVFEAVNGKEAIQMLEKTPIDIMLLDLEMPVMDGWETAKKVLSNFPHIYIIMISMHDSLQVISELVELGVHSYLLKDASPEEVRKAINTVYSNDFYYNQLVAKALHQKIVTSSKEKIQQENNTSLTKREIEILSLICQELTMKEIGEKLFLSEQTVHTHRKNLMKKTQVKNSVGLVKYAIQQKVIHL
jgi:DNA-binding NarL/FixJ family response regulator